MRPALPRSSPYHQDLHSIIVALAVASAVSVAKILYDLFFKPKVVWFRTEDPTLKLANVRIRTNTLVIQNVGLREEKNVRVIFTWREGGWDWAVLPTHIVWRRQDTQTGEVGICFEVIPRGQTVFVTYVYGTPPGPDEALDSISINGRLLSISTFPSVRRHAPWIHYSFRFLAFLGSWVVVYALLKGAVALWNFIPS